MERDGDSSEDDVDSLIDQLGDIKDRQAEEAATRGDCDTCSPPIYMADTRKRPVSELKAKHDDFHGYTNADYLRICKDCGSILSTTQVKNIR